MYRCVAVSTNAMSASVVKLTGTFGIDVTAYARYRWTCHEKFITYRAVRTVTNGTAFAHRFMLLDEWASHFLMALEAFFVPSQQTGT